MTLLGRLRRRSGSGLRRLIFRTALPLTAAHRSHLQPASRIGTHANAGGGWAGSPTAICSHRECVQREPTGRSFGHPPRCNPDQASPDRVNQAGVIPQDPCPRSPLRRTPVEAVPRTLNLCGTSAPHLCISVPWHIRMGLSGGHRVSGQRGAWCALNTRPEL